MPRFDILDKQGIDRLLDSIGLEIKVAGREAIGILPDANDNPEGRWSAVRDRLRRQGYQPPAALDPDGTIIASDLPRRPRIGIWLWPDNESTGEVEDFVETMVPLHDPVWPRSQAYIDGIPEADRRFSQGKVLKAKLHAWLATRETPSRMGAAIGARELDADGPLATKFVAWLRRLYA